jgi:putative hydrolase of the HAD superfamily
VTFDGTGTLFHGPRMASIYAEVFVRHGLSAEPEALDRVIRTVWQELSCRTDGSRDRFGAHPEGPRGWWGRFVERVAEHLDLPAPGPFVAAELYDRFARGDAWELYPGALSVLRALRGDGFALALISNWDDRLERVSEELGLASLLDAVVHSSGVGFEKPDPRIFRAALSRLGVEAGDAVHVGDRPKEDVEGAVAVGMFGVLIDRASAHGPGDADAVIRSLEELPPILRESRSSPVAAPT